MQNANELLKSAARARAMARRLLAQHAVTGHGDTLEAARHYERHAASLEHKAQSSHMPDDVAELWPGMNWR